MYKVYHNLCENLDLLKKGDKVKLRYNIPKDEGRDAQYSCSVDAGEIGEIRSISNENSEFELFLVKFPDDKSKQGLKNAGRYVKITRNSLKKK